jgi:hypothetical protein
MHYTRHDVCLPFGASFCDAAAFLSFSFMLERGMGRRAGKISQSVIRTLLVASGVEGGGLRRRSSKGFTWHHLMCHINMAHTCRNLSTCIKNGNGKVLIKQISSSPRAP